MAIVEDEMRNESEEENEIIVVEEYDGEQDSDDSDDDDADDEALERKVDILDLRLKQDPYNYEDHIEKIQALWGLSQLDRWRSSFTAMHQMMTVKPEHWLMRLHTETSVSHTADSRDTIADLFQQATLDCYSTQILSEWCSWSLSSGDVSHTRAQMEEVLKRAGADPLSGKVFWDAKMEFEKALLDNLNAQDEKYKEQRERVLFCLEEIVSRPLLRSDEMWQPFEELALEMHGQEYVDKAKKQHEAAQEYLHKITPYEDKLLTLENVDEKFTAYQEYIDAVSDLSKDDKYRECDSDGILRVLYDRVSTECITHPSLVEVLERYVSHARATLSRGGTGRVLRSAARRLPRQHVFWTMLMQNAEHEDKPFDEVKSIFEDALLKSMESYKQAECLWMSYLEYTRRRTDFNDEQHVERLRNTFRLAWDSLATEWGDEANDCELPVFWARLEYQRMKDHKRGKEVFEEIFRYGENKTMSKYWEALIRLEMNRTPSLSENKLRDLFRRALRSITDYPPAVVNMWKDYERDYGHLNTLRDCTDTCEPKLKEWRDYYKSMKDKMTGKKQQKTNKQNDKKNKFDKKKKIEDKSKNKGKRKSDGVGEGSEVKRKRDEHMEVDVSEKDSISTGVKRSHDEDEADKGNKRQRTDSTEDIRDAGREACTLFISNLEFKVNEQHLRDKLSQYGDIVSLRVKSGVKAFGGSICYCQYKNKSSVDEALKHDRTPLDGRPMFLSRYSAKKTKPQFKYATTTEKNKLFVKNLPFASCTKEALSEIFDKYGKLKDVRVVTHKDGKPKGLAYIEYEDELSASQALENTNGLKVGERNIEVLVSAPPARAHGDVTTLGQPKRDAGGGMRRTQISSFIPSVLQKPSTSKHADKQTNGDKRPMNNSDFRSMLLGNK